MVAKKRRAPDLAPASEGCASSRSVGPNPSSASASQKDGDSGNVGATLSSLQRIPYKERLFLNRKVITGETFLTDSLSMETRKLPAGEWEFEFDSEDPCMVAVVRSDEGGETPFMLAGDILQKDVAKDDKGLIYLRLTRKDKFYYPMERLLCSHKMGEVVLKLGAAQTSRPFEVCVLKMARSCGQRVFWLLRGVYKLLRLKAFGGEWSKWVWSSVHRWRKALEHFAGEHFIMSNHGNSNCAKTQSNDYSGRMLKEAAVDTLGLIMLLARWSHRSPQRGGLSLAENTDAAKEMLDGVVAEAAKRCAGKTFVVVFDYDWKCQWPRPDAMVEGVVSYEFTISSDGFLDLGPWFALEGLLATSPVARRWAQSFFTSDDLGAECDFSWGTVLKRSVGSPVLQASVAQVCFFLSMHMQMALGEGKDKEGDDRVFSFNDRRIWPGSPDLDVLLFSYVSACVQHSTSWNVLGVATDKASPCSGGAANTLFSYPDNKLAVGCPQVVRVEAGDEPLAERPGDKKRNSEEAALDECFDAVSKRQRGWLRRDQHTAAKSYRPVKHYRLSTKWWLLTLDNQIFHSTRFHGLEFFQHSEGWGDWRAWPAISFSIDLGGDGVAAWHAMTYYFNINGILFPDESHSCKNAFIEVAKALGIWNLLLIMLVSWNLEFGPRQEESRRNELRGALERCYAGHRPSQCPLFLELVPRIVSEVEQYDLMKFNRDRPIEDEVWTWLAERNRFGAMGRRVCTARYGAINHAIEKHRGLWSAQLWERTFVALEADFLASTKKAQLLVKSSVGDGAHDGSTNAPKGLMLDDKMIRGAAKNAVSISVMSLERREHQRVLNLLAEISQPLTCFHTEQNKEMRSVAGCEQRLLRMLNGGYMAHLAEFAKMLCNQGAMVKAGFIVEVRPPTVRSAAMHFDSSLEHEIVVEDEYASMFGRGLMAMIVARARRGLWMYGWPMKVYRILGCSEEEGKKTLEEFVADEQKFRALRDAPGATASVRNVVNRSVFQQVATKQVVVAVEELGVDAYKDQGFRTMVRNRIRCIQVTQAVEDVNSSQSISALAPCRKFRKPAAQMAAALDAKVVDERHKYEGIDTMAPPPCRRPSLPASVWQPNKTGTLDFGKIVSVAATPPYHSTTAERMTTPHADVHMLRQTSAEDASRTISFADLGQAFEAKNQVAIGIRAARNSEDIRWHLALYHFNGSATMVWPVTKRAFGNHFFFELDVEIDEPRFLSVSDLDPELIKVARYSWKSWLWQCKEVVGSRTGFDPAVRAFIKDEGSFLEVACRAGWWECSRTVIAEYAAHFKQDYPPGSSLFEILWALCKNALNIPDDQVLDIIQRRISLDTSQSDAASAVLEVEEATQVLEPMDVEEITHEQASIVSKRTAHQEISNEFSVKARAVRSATAKRGGKGKARQARVPLPHHVEQKDAKKYVPPGASLWRSRTRGEWNGHYREDYKRVCEPFHKHGSSAVALQHCLRRLWQQHLSRFGLDEADCPIEGLFGSS